MPAVEATKIKKLKKKGQKSKAKASFRRGSKRLQSIKMEKAAARKAAKAAALAMAAEEAKTADEGTYGEAKYSLLHLPKEAWPDRSRGNKGKHSYTLRSGDAAIEVLLRHGAFYVKKVGAQGEGPVGQISYKRQCPSEAWCSAKKRAGFA